MNIFDFGSESEIKTLADLVYVALNGHHYPFVWRHHSGCGKIFLSTTRVRNKEEQPFNRLYPHMSWKNAIGEKIQMPSLSPSKCVHCGKVLTNADYEHGWKRAHEA